MTHTHTPIRETGPDEAHGDEEFLRAMLEAGKIDQEEYDALLYAWLHKCVEIGPDSYRVKKRFHERRDGRKNTPKSHNACSESLSEHEKTNNVN